ncbi:hypothetical protein AX14_007931, partial [Amanita brunnescens Koide BX004]
MIDELEIALPEYASQASHARCFLHTTNLVAKALIRTFDAKKKKRNDGAASAPDELEKLCADSEHDEREMLAQTEGSNVEDGEDDVDGLIDITEEMDPRERVAHEERICPVRLVLAKLRKLAFKIINSTTSLLPAWYQTVANLPELRRRTMPRDVQTRWNSTFDMLRFAVKYEKAIKSMTQTMDLGLRQYELSPEEWKIAKQLTDVLKILKDGTAFFSRKTPSLATVIPAMDHIEDTFRKFSNNKEYDPAIRSAVDLAQRTLNRYYSLTDASEVYRIAMILHPRHKLAYFQKSTWLSDWVDLAQTLVRDEFERNYMAISEGEDEGDKVDDAPGATNADNDEHVNIFNQLPTLAPLKPSDLRSEIDRYLSSDIEDVDDALSWWHEKRATFPRLSRMALDYLSIP